MHGQAGTQGWRGAGALALVYVVYVATAWLGLKIALEGTPASAVWPPAGIGLAAVLLLGRRASLAIGLAAAMVNAAVLATRPEHPGALPIALCALSIGFGNACEALLAAGLIARWNEQPDHYPATPRRAVGFLVAAATGCALSASIGVSASVLSGVVPAALGPSSWLTWWGGDVASALVIGLLILAFARPAARGEGSLVEGAVALLSLATACLAFLGPWVRPGMALEGLPYLTLPPLLWVAIRFGARAGTVAVLLLASVAVAASVADQGAFAGRPLSDELLRLMGYAAVCAGVTLVLSAAVGAHADLRQRLAEEVAQRHEAERAEREAQLQARLEAGHRLESVGLLAGGVAHDMNNLLLGVFLNCDRVEDRLAAGEDAREPLRGLRDTAERLKDLAGQMLAASGRGPLRSEPVAADELVRDTARLLERALPPGARLELDLGSQVTVQSDPTQLRQVVLNLITNAAEALGGEPGAIRLTTRAVEREAGELRALDGEPLPAGRYLELEVQDEGRGMDEATRARAFEPFFSTKATGRGLGLATVFGVVRGHAGTLSVESHPGVGTTFRLSLPATLAVPAPVPAPVPSAAPAETGPPERASQLVLVADDQEVVRTTVRALLERAGYRVIPAQDGRQAVARFAERPDEVGVVLFDLSMPGLDGDAALREVRALRPGVPAVIMTGYGEGDVQARLREHRPGLLTKPFSAEQLYAAVRSACRG
ncbi:MAG: MASE1 domain-containing protein [Planctomycetota bacterium]